jgi:general secretion pathway protein D
MATVVGALATASGSTTVNPEAIKGVAGAFSSNVSIGILSGQKVNIPGIGEVTPGALINLMKTDANSRNLASPNILTSNNEEANITVGDKLIFPTTVVASGGATSQQVQKEDVDTSMTIKPNISNSNYVTLNFQIEANRVTTIDQKTGFPQIGKRKTKQSVIVKNGQTVVISGLIMDAQSESYQKIPLLGDIPVLGWLFRNSSISSKKSNLVIFLTPHIIHGAEDLATVYKKKMKERDEYFEQIFGRKYANDEFYQKLPKSSDGEYRPTADDDAEDRRQAKTQEELKKMMDLGSEDQKAIDAAKAQKKGVSEEAITVPVPTGGDAGPTGAVMPLPEAPAPAPMEEELPPPPPPPTE